MRQRNVVFGIAAGEELVTGGRGVTRYTVQPDGKFALAFEPFSGSTVKELGRKVVKMEEEIYLVASMMAEKSLVKENMTTVTSLRNPNRIKLEEIQLKW